MKNTLSKLKVKRYMTSILLVVLIVFVIGLISTLGPKVKNIKVKDVFIQSSSLNASVIDGVSEGTTSNNYDEIKYKLKVNKENSDTAIIVGKLSDKENKYARFKSTKEGIVTDNGKTITVTTTKNKVDITVVVENAPYGTTVDPKFTINSEDESKSKINVDAVTITGKSVEGTVTDEKGTLYTGIELKLTKNDEEVKRTYTKDDGKYVFALGDTEGYQVTLAETKYQIVRYEEETTDENRRILNVVIKEVEPFDISIRKTISKLDLVVNGKKQTYTYDDASVVSRSVKGARTIEGSIYYNISIKNTGEVKGTLTVLKDIIPDGLSFDESKNPGWTIEGKYLFYTPLEGKEIEPFGKEKITLVLDIVKTEEARTYINTVNANGEDYKYVVYYLNNNIFKEEYVINSEKIEDLDPNVENFDGWYTDKNYTNKFDFKLPVTKDTILFGKIKNNKYTVSFIDVNPNNNQETVLDIIEIDEGDTLQTDLIAHPDYRGYTFKCFKLYDKCYDNEEITDDVNLYTSHKINEYDIDYDLDDGSLAEENPDRYTVNDEITLHNPTKEGHTFTGWLGTDLSELTLNVTIPRGSIGDREYIANFELNKSTLTVNPNGGTYAGSSISTIYTEDYGTIKHINDSEKTGYKFKRYSHTGGGTFSNGTFTFDNDDATLTAEYEKITYTITYENITDAERTALNNRTEYDVETETFTLHEPSTRLDADGNPSQDFVGWDDGSGTASKDVTIPKGSTGNKTYTAVWRQNGKEYAIVYKLHGGTPTGPNPSTYTRTTETFTLNNPEKAGYRFTGWSGTGLIGETNQVVTIPKGSAGDREYEAHYEIIEYPITYNGLLPTEDLGNPPKYTIESDDITLNDPSRTGYNFLGWTGSNGDTPGSVTIPHGSTGAREYTVNFSLIEYSLTYTLNGGDYETGKTNPPKYTVESDDITLNNPSKDGYTFTGWTGTGVTTPTEEVTIPTGSIGHRSFLANYNPIVYTITYDYGEGALPTGVTNPDRYTIESDEITFNAPEREGYDFTHYTEQGNIITSIPTGSMGNKSLLAHYQIKTYNVRYFNESTLYHTDEVDWNNVTIAPANAPTKAHNIFLYWSEDGTNPYDFTTQITADKNLYAVYEEVVAPTITFDPLLDDETNRTWVCSDSSNNDCGVTVTITSDHDDYDLYYKIGDGTAILYTGPFKVYENTTITAFSKKSNIYSEETSSDIVNVDSIAPTINQPATGSMSFNMTVSGTAQDAGSGVKKFTLYVKEKDAILWDDTLTYESETFEGIRDHAENYDHTFYGVHDNTEYIVKIVAEDYVGNISEREVEVTTHPYVARVVGKNGILWYTVDPDTKEFVIDDGKEFLMFDSIQAAVDYCAEVQCTIQTNPIMPVVEESVVITSNQNITIDLDGRGIVSEDNATFVNNGKLQIVDRNPRMNGQEHESIGFVKNTVGKAIINNDRFILGDGSSEPSETFIYPELDRPLIEGYQAAIEQNNLFYFYDGKLLSDTITLIDNGEDPITQYSYNIVISSENEKHIGSLAIVDDPEARIKSTYYTKLKVAQGDNAFDSSRTGTMSSESAKMLSKIKQYGDYGFVYDSVNDLIYNGNSSTANTTAISYIKIDLTEYNEDQILSIDAFADTYSSSSYGYVAISETLGDISSKTFTMWGNDAARSKITILEKGKVYYVHFGFVKGGKDINIYETFKITRLSLLGEREGISDDIMVDDPTYFNFERQADGSYISTNKGVARSNAHSYVVFDLTEETSDLNLSLDVSISSQGNRDFGYVYHTYDDKFQEYNNTNGRFIYIGGESQNVNYEIVLEAGKVHYIHFGYRKNEDTDVGDDTFTINRISLTKHVKHNVIAESELKHNDGDTYYFDQIYSWEDSISHEDYIAYNATINEEQNGIVLNGNGHVPLYQINTPEFTWHAKFNASANNGVIVANFQSGGAGLMISGNKVRLEIYIDGGYKNLYSLENIEYGRDYEVTATYKDGTAILYLDGVEQERYEGTTYSYPKDNTIVMVGADPNGSSPSGSSFAGTIYDVKIYDRELSADEVVANNSTEGLVARLEGNSTKIQHNMYRSNNTNINSSISHSYLTYDLTNSDEDMYLYINTYISSESGADYGIVQVTDSPEMPTSTTGRFMYVSGEANNQAQTILLPKNKVNYVHFMYSKSSTTHKNKDIFIIKEISVSNKLEDIYTISGNNHRKIDSIYFEKPILNDTVDTIEILKNITLDATLTVPQEKEVILDLNGFTITSNKDDYVIKNYGKLTVIDSDYSDRVQGNIDYKIEQARLFEEANVQYQEDLIEYQEYAGLCDGCEVSDEYKLDHIDEYISEYGYSHDETYEYDYTGEGEKVSLTTNGLYKVELWGAQGGNGWTSAGGNGYCTGGKGAYTSGLIKLNTTDDLYVYVGALGESGYAGGSYKSTSFNGGGYGGYGGWDDNGGSGGGATDIRIVNGDWDDPTSLNSRIMVAAGGGGGACIANGTYTNMGYRAGGTLTVPTERIAAWDSTCEPREINQLSGGSTFGKGANALNRETAHGAGGGGGGYYGGSYCERSNLYTGGTGGVSYISGYTGSIAVESASSSAPRTNLAGVTCSMIGASTDEVCSEHYSGLVFTNPVMISGKNEMPTYDGQDVMTGNASNGHSKISLVLTDEEYETIKEALPKTYNVKEEPAFANYLYEIGFEDGTDIYTLTPDSENIYRDNYSEDKYGKIVSTISDVILNEQYATLILDSCRIDINANSKSAIHNRGDLIVRGTTEINTNNNSDTGIFNESNGNMVSFSGSINVNGTNSVGLLNRSNDTLISGVTIKTSVQNDIAVKNEALVNMTYDKLNISGTGTGFSESSSGDTAIQNSSIKSTNTYSVFCTGQARESKFYVNSSSLGGQLYASISPRQIYVNNSNATNIYNYSGNVFIKGSTVNKIVNRGDMLIEDSTLTNNEGVVENNAGKATSGGQVKAKMLIKNTSINYTGTATDVNVIFNNDTLTLRDVEVNNINGAKTKAIQNSSVGYEYNSYDGLLLDTKGYLTILGNTTIDPTFGTAINNTSNLIVGSINQNSETNEYVYPYTGKQEVFTAPADGLYKLETWGAQGGNAYDYSCYMGTCTTYFRGGLGAYASGTIELHEGDKLYIHVGAVGSSGMQDGVMAYYGAYNGGGADTASIGGWPRGSGGGATDISFSDEDNVWTYDNGLTLSKRSQASYEQRILVAGAGSGKNKGADTYGGYPVDPSTTRMGYSSRSGGGGYYAGTYGVGGSSYASDILTDVVLKTGIEEMPNYYGSGLMLGNSGFGYAKITYLDDNSDTVTDSPTISATNYGVTGSGKFYFYDGTISATKAVSAAVDVVPEGYDIYIKTTDKETMNLIANSDSRPVEPGEEEFVCRIGDAKYTTIQNALDASNNGDTIVLIADIDQQNDIMIPSTKIITIDYNGHRVDTYSNNYLFYNSGNLTIVDSQDAKVKNTLYGNRYLYNKGTLNLNDIYIDDFTYVKTTIENSDGTITMNNVKLDFGNHSESDKFGILNSEYGEITINNSELKLWANNKFVDNNGTFTIKNSTLTSNNSASIVKNEEVGTAVLDGCTFVQENAHNSYGMYLLENYGDATIKNMDNKKLFTVPNSGVLTLENNTLTEGTINNSGLVIVNSGTYNTVFNLTDAGKSIDDTDNKYSMIMHDGTINTSINRTGTGTMNIESGTIDVTNGIAINNSGAGVINLGIHDGHADIKTNTRPIITGKTYGIYTSNPSLKVNFYDGVISAQKAYNVTIENIETGYSIKREYDETNDIETKYLTDEPMFINETQNVMYNSIDDFNDALTNGLIDNNDLIKVYRDITVGNTDPSIIIPNGLSIRLDLNGKVIDKNNETLFINNGELSVSDSNINDTVLVDSTLGNIFVNNGTLSISGGTFVSEQASYETEVIKNNENATLIISNGNFTKYYDIIGTRLIYSGAIIDNSGTANITGGGYTTNGSYVIEGPSLNYFSTTFLNRETGILNVTGGSYTGVNGKLYSDGVWQNPSSTYINKGSLIYNYGTATIKDILSKQSLIGGNDGTLTLDHVTMYDIVQITHSRYSWIAGSNHNLINTGDLTVKNSMFEIRNSFIENNGGNVTIDSTIIDKLNDGIRYADGDRNDHLQKNSHLIRNKYNSGSSNIVTIKDSELYNRGSGEVIDNFGNISVIGSTLQATNNNVIKGSASIVLIDNSNIITAKGVAMNLVSSTNTNIVNNSSVISDNGNAINNTNSTLIVGEAIIDDGAVSQTYPIIKGTSYAINNSGTFKFYDGILYGKTATVNGSFNVIEDGYALVHGTEDDYNTTILDKVPIIQNITQATALDEKKYYDLATAFADARDGDILQMLANYNNLPIDATAVNDYNVTLDLNGKFIKQSNDILMTNNGTLTIVDSSEGNLGSIQAITGTETFDNNGTINLIDAKVSTTFGILLFNNNSGATLTIKDQGIVDSNSGSLLIDNSGTLNIYNGAYLHNVDGRMIINNDTLNIIDFNNDDDPNTSSNLTAPWIYGEGSGYGGGSHYSGEEFIKDNASINTSVGSITTIYGGIFNNGKTYATGDPDASRILNNNGTATIKHLDSYAWIIGYNFGSLTIEDSHFYNTRSGFLQGYSGTYTIKNVTIDVTEYGGWDVGHAARITIGEADIDNLTISMKNNSCQHGALLYIRGDSTIKNSNISSCMSSEYYSLYITSDVDIENTTISSNRPVAITGKVNLDNTSISSSGTTIINGGTLDINQDSTISSSGGYAIENTGTLNVNSGSSVVSTASAAIQLNNRGIVNLGEIGGVPDTENPYIEGTTFGIYRSTQTATINFYDGLVVGKTGPNAIYGGVTSVEGGYETENIEETNPEDITDKTYKEYLVVSASSVAIAKVGNYTFTTNSTTSSARALQNAVNFAIGDGSNIKNVDLVANVDLVNDEYSVTASMPVTINTNGFTINQNSTYYLDSNINQNTSSVGGSVSKFLSDVFDLTSEPKNIIIYELSDGSSLDSAKTYKLYRDGKVLKLEKEELGRYRYQGDNESLTPIRGRLYIDNLQKGSYKLESSDNKYIEFSIDSDGNISGNVVENTISSKSSSTTAKSEAELILSIQTGMTRHYYLLFIIPIAFIIILLMLINKYKKREIN